MEVESYFAPPDPSGEVFLPSVSADPSGEVTLPIAPPEPDRPSTKVRAAMVVAVALVAVAGLFFVGRWTTGGERDALADERDAAQAERDQLQRSLDEARNDLADAIATNSTNQSTIDELESAATRDKAVLTSLRADVTRLTNQASTLQDVNDQLGSDLGAVSECGNTMELADTAMDKWGAWYDALVVYGPTEVGSEEERQAGEALDQAWADRVAAESDYVASSGLCRRAIESLPACDDPAALRLATESQEPPCATTN